MPTNNSQVPRPPNQRKRLPDALERLYVYWILSTALLLFALIVATVYTRGAQQQQARQYEQAIGELAQRVAALEAGPVPTQPARAAGEASQSSAAERQPAPTATQPGTAAPDAGSTNTSADPPPSDSDVETLLNRALTTGPATGPMVVDRACAERVLKLAQQHAARAAWGGATWARLAVLARLLADDSLAETLAGRAHRAGDRLVTYSEVSARLLLARGQVEPARLHAEHFAERTSGSATARLLLAQVFLAQESPATADELIGPLSASGSLTAADRLALARGRLALHQWDRLGEIMETLTTVPGELETERNFLRAVALIQRNERLVEALSLLDYLADHAGPTSAPVAGPARVPDAYEIATWRGVALTRGQQPAAARQALDAAIKLAPQRPEAYYWKALLEIRAGQTDGAKTLLESAVTSSARYAPAWETLGLLALNEGNLDAALVHLSKALAANERQASTHFLLAVAHAKASRREPAAAALRTALALDPTYVEKAAATEVLMRLFNEDDLKSFAAAGKTGSANDPDVPNK